ncbi:RNA methyltransferase [Pacificimonas flava]|uniref:RNA methyltransferase n=2 Tax=Pacificimonas TaxID=1960290 RepID=A0A219B496_9SPHN|nr:MULTISPECIES: RNA methyltransferase [Pacificimonas]MBZ6377081.1 RNA methyltransferase [Pacificimonas aurantium]OWV33187.1 RNA methyltransferase [Pacificimonas flava]
MPRDITSFSNATVKRVRSLAQKKHRILEGLFMAEGLRICAEALEAGHVPRILVSRIGDTHELTLRLEREVEAAGGEALRVPGDILEKITGKANPQAVVGVFGFLETGLARLDRSASGIWIVCQSLKDPGNLGTILRTADAVGGGGVILLDQSCDPFSVEAVRASMGAIFTVPLAQADGQDFFTWLRSGPGMLVGASLNTDRDYQGVSYAPPTFVFMGNEQRGLPPDYEAACDELVKIPMRGKADSLNVAVSCAVMVYEVLNQQRRR